MQQLLVEIGAQPLQLLGVAKLLGPNDFVVFLGVGDIGVARPARLRGVLAALAGVVFLDALLALLEGFAERRFGGLDLAFEQRVLKGRRSLLIWTRSATVLLFSPRTRSDPCPGLVLRLVLGRVLRLRIDPGHLQLPEQMTHDLRETPLILDGAESWSRSPPAWSSMNSCQSSTSLAPCGGGARPVSRSRAISASASSSGASSRLCAASNCAPIAIVQHGADVGGDARHAASADGFDAGLLHRIEYRLAFGGRRRQAAMHGVVVTGEPQRQRIGAAAQDRRVLQRELARRVRQPGFDPLLVRRQRRAVPG